MILTNISLDGQKLTLLEAQVMEPLTNPFEHGCRMTHPPQKWLGAGTLSTIDGEVVDGNLDGISHLRPYNANTGG